MSPGSDIPALPAAGSEPWLGASAPPAGADGESATGPRGGERGPACHHRRMRLTVGGARPPRGSLLMAHFFAWGTGSRSISSAEANHDGTSWCREGYMSRYVERIVASATCVTLAISPMLRDTETLGRFETM